MGKFRGFDGLDGSKQREGMKNWGPTAFPVVEPVLFRSVTQGLPEVLVCRRLKGALSVAKPPACTTSNPGGGHILPGKDDTPRDAVVRSIAEKIGYDVDPRGIRIIGTAGPALNWSHVEAGEHELIIEDRPAEPEVPFIAHVYAVDMSLAKKRGEGNGSLEEIGWMSWPEIFGRYGNSGTHIYFQFLCAAMGLFGDSSGEIPWKPGIYRV